MAGESVPRDVIQQIFSELLEGVGYLHSNGVIHRNLKPENILRDTYGSVKIGDFGLAEKVQEASIVFTGCEGCGTYGYGSGTHTLIADVYSMGVILFELATGEEFIAGFAADNLEAWIFEALLDHNVEQDLLELIAGMTERNPN